MEEVAPAPENSDSKQLSPPENVMEKQSKENSETPKIESENVENEEDPKSDRSENGGECSEETDTDDASVILEREEGDGQESTPNRKVDDDEDKRNPQYIPKRGTFYEHDDRTAVEEGEEDIENTETAEKDAAPKKKVWSEKEGTMWRHDRYNDDEQAPKSRSELISIYGYDIRNEDGPPRARRRRRYGRGPNKYTRKWEDEEAYSKPTNVTAKPPQRKIRPRSKPGEDFPPLDGSKSGDRDDSPPESVERDRGDAGNKTNDPTSDEQQENGSRERPKADTSQIQSTEEGEKETETAGYKQQVAHSPPKKDARALYKGAPKPKSQNEPRGTVDRVRGVTKTRGFFKNGGRATDVTRARNQKNQRQSMPPQDYTNYILSQNFTNKAVNEQEQHQQKLEKDMANLSVQDDQQQQHGDSQNYGGPAPQPRGGSNKFAPNSGGGNRQNSVPPRLQAEQRGSKRYSSLRQRSLPETAAPTFGQHPTFYPTEYGQQGASQQQGQQELVLHPTPSMHSQVPTNNAQVISVAPTNQPLAALHQAPPANGAPPLMQAPPPPQFAQSYPQAPPAFIQAGVAPPFLPQQGPPPQIINYAQPQFAQPGFTNFQHQQFNPVNQAQPPELYQPQGGITYYSTQNQQIVARVPQKRVKAAIPIVPPPEHKEPRGRGRLNQGEDSPVGSAPETPAETYHDQQQGQPLALDSNAMQQFTQENAVAVQQ